MLCLGAKVGLLESCLFSLFSEEMLGSARRRHRAIALLFALLLTVVAAMQHVFNSWRATSATMGQAMAHVASAQESNASQFSNVTLCALPTQPAGVVWPPRATWPNAIAASSDLQQAADKLFDEPLSGYSHTYGLLVVHRSEVVYERYDSIVAADLQIHTAWSVCKSLVHAVVGILVGQGRLDIDAPGQIPEWASPGDPRRAITVRTLMQMRSGLLDSPPSTDFTGIAAEVGDLSKLLVEGATLGPHPIGSWYQYGTRSACSRSAVSSATPWAAAKWACARSSSASSLTRLASASDGPFSWASTLAAP